MEGAAGEISGLRRQNERFSIDFRRYALPHAPRIMPSIVRDVQHLAGALLRAGVLDEHHQAPQWRPHRGEPAPRARLAHCTCARARFRPLGSAQRRAIGPRAARVPARARAPASLSSASTNPPALPAKAARRRRAAQRRKFWRRGLKLGHFSRPLGHRREQHGALEAPCPAGAFAPGLGGRAAFLLADCGGSEATADSARNGQLARDGLGRFGEGFLRAAAPRSPRDAKELAELRTFDRSFVGLGHLKHELDPHYTPTSAWKEPKDSIEVQSVEQPQLAQARVNRLKYPLGEGSM